MPAPELIIIPIAVTTNELLEKLLFLIKLFTFSVSKNKETPLIM